MSIAVFLPSPPGTLHFEPQTPRAPRLTPRARGDFRQQPRSDIPRQLAYKLRHYFSVRARGKGDDRVPVQREHEGLIRRDRYHRIEHERLSGRLCIVHVDFRPRGKGAGVAGEPIQARQRREDAQRRVDHDILLGHLEVEPAVFREREHVVDVLRNGGRRGRDGRGHARGKAKLDELRAEYPSRLNLPGEVHVALIYRLRAALGGLEERELRLSGGNVGLRVVQTPAQRFLVALARYLVVVEVLFRDPEREPGDGQRVRKRRIAGERENNDGRDDGHEQQVVTEKRFHGHALSVD